MIEISLREVFGFFLANPLTAQISVWKLYMMAAGGQSVASAGISRMGEQHAMLLVAMKL